MRYLKKSVLIGLILSVLCLTSVCVGNLSNLADEARGIFENAANTEEVSMEINVENLDLTCLSFYHNGMSLHLIYS